MYGMNILLSTFVCHAAPVEEASAWQAAMRVFPTLGGDLLNLLMPPYEGGGGASTVG